MGMQNNFGYSDNATKQKRKTNLVRKFIYKSELLLSLKK